MTETAPPAGQRSRLARFLLLVYCVFVVYGSFFPFRFTADPAVVRAQASRIVFRPFDARTGRRVFSIPDVASNVLLGVPAGALLVAAGLVGKSVMARLAGVALLEMLFAAAVEAGQVFTPGRKASLLDVEAQVAGALIGAVAAQLLLGPRARVAGRHLGAMARSSPAAVVVVALAAALAADSLYPYAVTLDVSTAWGNLKRAQWAPLGSFGRRFWADLIVERGLTYMALAAAAWLALGPLRLRQASGGLIWGLATAWAMALEVGKLLIVGRAPNIDHVLLASAGAGLGVLGAPALFRHPWLRVHGPTLLALAAAALLIYEELTPFGFAPSSALLAAKAARIDWIPLGSYFYASSQSALFDLGKKLLLGGFLGAALAAGGWRLPWAWGLGLGCALEGAQLLQVAHVPSVTDALSITAGVAAGAGLVARRRGGDTTGSAEAGSVSDWRH